MQNFRAKPRTAMQGAPDAALLEYVAAVAVARLVMGAAHAHPGAAEPLRPGGVRPARPRRRRRLGRRLAAHRRPRQPRAALAAPRRSRRADRRARLRAARAAHRAARVRDRRDEWIDPGLHAAVAALADRQTGLAAGRARQTPPERARERRNRPPQASRRPISSSSAKRGTGIRRTGRGRSIRSARPRRRRVGRAARGHRRRSRAADRHRRRRAPVHGRRGREPRRQPQPHLDRLSLGARQTTRRRFTLDDVAEIAADAWELGATELCVQGLLPAERGARVLSRHRPRSEGRRPRMHLHAYRPQDVWDLADRSGLGLRGRVDGDARRRVSTRSPAPASRC